MTAAADLGTITARVGARVAGPRPTSTGVSLGRRRASLALVAPLRADVSRVPFVAVLVSLLAAGLLGLLMLNTALAQGSFALFTLSNDARALADREQTLLREVEALRSPETLASKATDLGMVQGGQPAFLRLPDGAILGADLPAELPEQELPLGEPSDAAEDEPAEAEAAQAAGADSAESSTDADEEADSE